MLSSQCSHLREGHLFPKCRQSLEAQSCDKPDKNIHSWQKQRFARELSNSHSCLNYDSMISSSCPPCLQNPEAGCYHFALAATLWHVLPNITQELSPCTSPPQRPANSPWGTRTSSTANMRTPLHRPKGQHIPGLLFYKIWDYGTNQEV